MAAFIFICDQTTERECLDRNLFGTNPGEGHRLHYSKIAIGDTLFLYNLDMGTLRGPFVASTGCKMNIEPDAWKSSRRKFPWQVKVDDAQSFHLPLSADDVQQLVELSATPAGLLPPKSIDEEQADALVEALRTRNAA
jgi:hypothetical protein